RNQLKLPDLTEPEHFIRGDPLVRLDRRLAALLDGVYRPSEVYARWLERATSLFFGTTWGRALTLYLLLPLLASWVVMYLLGMGLHYATKDRSAALEKVSVIMMGPLHELQEKAKTVEEQKKRPAAEKAEKADEEDEAPGHTPPPFTWHLLSLLPGAVFVMLLI